MSLQQREKQPNQSENVISRKTHLKKKKTPFYFLAPDWIDKKTKAWGNVLLLFLITPNIYWVNK